jgi:DNA-binding transcriptional regulator YiaG
MVEYPSFQGKDYGWAESSIARFNTLLGKDMGSISLRIWGIGNRIPRLSQCHDCSRNTIMPNMAAVIKGEIARLAKKEAKSATSQLKRASVRHRTDIAKLKRLFDQQEKEIKLLKKQAQQQQGQPQPTEDELEGVRFSARSVKGQRQRLGLSAANYGKLVGVSGLTIYAWEQGKSKPRKAQLAALVAVRGIGKREALKRLAELTPKKKGNRR